MIEKMPNDYKGKKISKSKYTSTTPRKWTQKEIEWLELKTKEGYSSSQIAYSMDRSQTSVAIKQKRLTKKENTYNKRHINEKYEINELFLEMIQPITVLDLYAGEKNFYKDYQTITNDINSNINVDYHKDSFKLICELYSKDYKFDLIDLDPFGSAYDCFDLAVKMAQKGLCITLGELGHKRWKRLDFVKTHYNITDIKDFNIKNLINYIKNIGLRNKKKLEVFEYREWQNIGRVWFVIDEADKFESQVKEAKKVYDIFDALEEN